MFRMSHALKHGSIPALGLGTWQSKPGEVGQAVRVALNKGYRHIDCAYIYQNQEEIGQVFSEFFGESGSLKRQDVWVTSKLWNTSHRAADVKEELKKTLQQLQLEYLDLYLIHWPVSFAPGDELFPKDGENMKFDDQANIQETWKAMEELKRDGLVKNIGVSNFNIRRLKELLSFASIYPAVNQVELHPYLTQQELVKFCQENHIHLTAYCPLGSGKEPRLLDDPVINAIASSHNKTAAHVLIRWALQRGTSVIPKSVTPSRIEANFQVFDFELSSDEIEKINGLNKNHRFVNPQNFWNLNVFEE